MWVYLQLGSHDESAGRGSCQRRQSCRWISGCLDFQSRPARLPPRAESREWIFSCWFGRKAPRVRSLRCVPWSTASKFAVAVLSKGLLHTCSITIRKSGLGSAKKILKMMGNIPGDSSGPRGRKLLLEPCGASASPIWRCRVPRLQLPVLRC